MRTPVRYALRFTLAVAILMSLSLFLPTRTAAHGPYVSALGDLTAASAFAAPACENKFCMRNAQGKALCQASPNTNCIRRKGGVLCGYTAC